MTPESQQWRRASRCGANGCVEVAVQGDQVRVRQSRHPDGPSLEYSRAEWQRFIRYVKAGNLDL
jgi:hypothetical protein